MLYDRQHVIVYVINQLVELLAQRRIDTLGTAINGHLTFGLLQMTMVPFLDNAPLAILAVVAFSAPRLVWTSIVIEHRTKLKITQQTTYFANNMTFVGNERELR